ncbi:MAG: CHRD domain-containing protein [Chitinophagaceae bacterium]
MSANLNEVQVADLFANLYYINAQTSAYPAGEIRGQVIRQ